MHWLLRIAFGIVALVAAANVLRATVAFYSSFGSGANEQIWYTYALIAGATTLLFPAGIQYLPRGHIMRKLGWTAFAAAVCFNVLGVWGFYYSTRGADLEAKSGNAMEWSEQKREVERLRAKADEFAKSRITGAIEAELTAAKAAAPSRGCDQKNSYVDSCQKLFELNAELATARERDKRENAYGVAKSKFDNMERPNEAKSNPQAAGFSFLRSAGIDVNFFMSLIISVLTVAISEVVPVVSSFLALHGGSVPARSHKATKEPEPPDVSPFGNTPQRAARRPRGPPADLLATLAAVRSGALTGKGLAIDGAGIVISNRALALASGFSASKVNTELQALAAAGKVELRPGPGGTYVELKP